MPSWLLLGPPGSSWLLLAPPGSSWLLLAPPGSSWFLLVPPRSPWLLLAPPGFSVPLEELATRLALESDDACLAGAEAGLKTRGCDWSPVM